MKHGDKFKCSDCGVESRWVDGTSFTYFMDPITLACKGKGARCPVCTVLFSVAGAVPAN